MAQPAKQQLIYVPGPSGRSLIKRGAQVIGDRRGVCIARPQHIGIIKEQLRQIAAQGTGREELIGFFRWNFALAGIAHRMQAGKQLRRQDGLGREKTLVIGKWQLIQRRVGDGHCAVIQPGQAAAGVQQVQHGKAGFVGIVHRKVKQRIIQLGRHVALEIAQALLTVAGAGKVGEESADFCHIASN